MALADPNALPSAKGAALRAVARAGSGTRDERLASLAAFYVCQPIHWRGLRSAFDRSRALR